MTDIFRPGPGSSFIWATRGRTWGFRFLRSAGFNDPLQQYERAFVGVENEPEVCRLVKRDTVALRFPDPEGRCDSAGRIIPHDFVLLGEWANEIDSVARGVENVWPKVANEFALSWESEVAPQVEP